MFYLMAHGLPGSGKSTLFAELKRMLEEHGVDYWAYNRDELRTEVAGESYHLAPPVGRVERAVNELVAERLESAYGRHALILDDNTNLNRKTVNSVRRGLAEKYELVHLVVLASLELSLERNEARGAAGGRRVPKEVIERMASVGFPQGVFDFEAFVGEDRSFVFSSPEQLPSLAVLFGLES